MTYKIIGDSCLDLTEKMKQDPHFQMVPLTLQVGSAQIVDDETFDQAHFLELVKACPECPKTACPSPEMFKKAFQESGAEAVFVITLSSHLSGSYNSAVLAKRLYEEEYAERGEAVPVRVAVLDSESASAGELTIALYAAGLFEAGLKLDEVVKKAVEFRDTQHTYFVLETLDALRKNGRLSGLQAFFATALNIKPVMGADQGSIVKLDQARGINKALQRMCDIAVQEAKGSENRVAVIAHCNNARRAEYVKAELMKRAGFKEVVITETAGVATVYAADGGIVLAL